MIIYAVYVITSTGMTVFSENYQDSDKLPNEVLFGGLLTVIQDLTVEITSNEMTCIDLDGIYYHFKPFGFFRVVIITDDVESPDRVMFNIGLRFMRDYGEILIEQDDKHERSVFYPFKGIVSDIIKKEDTVDENRHIDPVKRLTTAEILCLPSDLHTIALTMLSLKRGTIITVSKEIGETNEVTKKGLIKLQEMGYLGIEMVDNEQVFFCSG